MPVVMLAAMLAAALWIWLATWAGAPVSTTHSIVGGIAGAGVAVYGLSAVLVFDGAGQRSQMLSGCCRITP